VFLSPTSAGALTDTEPSTTGQVRCPVLDVIDATTVYVRIGPSMVIGAGVSTHASSHSSGSTDPVTVSNLAGYVDPTTCHRDVSILNEQSAAPSTLAEHFQVYGVATTAAYVYTSDLCAGGTALESSHYSTFAVARAVDDSNSTFWMSGELGTGISGVSYLGYDFGVGKTIRKITVKQGDGDYNDITSVILRYSDNGSSWTTVQTIALAKDSSVQAFTFSNTSSHRYWSLLANDNLGAGAAWAVTELEMMELTSGGTNETIYCKFPSGYVLTLGTNSY
jgi:hypothetical protein